ncbi:MAG TPA: peptidoglycan recognition family protein [Anaerolineae bacterium]|nr:peptidoglycan recognition family protein [Anaerolineae bacterium]HOQ99012.1 peptidoglycan recognition family protein [Anaerolineae bacterium]HPL28857.1 peptidoglycan recognition family protein [Anaerolineae bacterium]
MLEYRDWYGTQNWSDREAGGIQYSIRYIIIHDTEGPRDAALAWWCSPNNPSQSSAHDLIDSAGVIHHCVPYEKAAHHAGGSHIPGFNQPDPATGRCEPNANLASIGIELEYPAAPASPPWPQVQLDAAVAHVRGLVQIYQVPRANMLRHAEVDPKNRSDPRSFPWQDFVARVYHGIDDALADTLRNAAWNAGGIPFNREAAFPRYAREHGLGNPETPEFDFGIAGQQYRGQGFSRGIIYARVGEWGDIREVIW